MTFAALKEHTFTAGELQPLTVAPFYPAIPSHHQKQLAVTSGMPTNGTVGAEVNDVYV